MRTSLSLSLFLGLAACGSSSNNNTTPDAPTVVVPPMIKISGIATGRSGTSTTPTPLSGVTVSAFKNSDDTTAIQTATSAADGSYSLEITTGGQALDGFVKATITGFLDTYLYAPAPLAADFASASINMVDSGIYDLLANTLCAGNQMTTNGVIALEVQDDSGNTIAGATATTSPAPTGVCYDNNGFPNKTATVTASDGIAYIFNVTGEATVSASLTGMTFTSHQVNARAGALTTTIVAP
jgi:hypothetical protein